MSHSPNQLRRFLPRFSLLTLLLLTTIIALSLALWQVGSEVVPLREEVHQLREETGRLVVDPEFKDRIQAIGVPNFTAMTWKWKVYLPPNQKYVLKIKWNDISSEGLPQSQSSVRAIGGRGVDGEWTITCAIRRNPKNTRWDIVTEYDVAAIASYSTRRSIPQDAEQWIDSPEVGSSTSGVARQQVVVANSDSLVLLRWRLMEKVSPTTSKTPKGPARGLMIWIEPK